MSSTALNDGAIEELIRYVIAWTGYRPDPEHASAVRRAVRSHLQRGRSLPDLLRRVAEGDAELIEDLLEAVAVRETYFFRHPEHFEWLRRDLAPTFAGREVVRAWSAGCATGEEAYSLAACLLASVLPPTRVEVLGTDLLGRNVAVARAGVYGAWSHRASTPRLFPVCEPTEDGRTRVLPRVRSVTRFQQHSLVDPPPSLSSFDVVFCRNVLLYFGAHAAEHAIEHIVSALGFEGVVLFGTLDVSGVPSGLDSVEGAELNTFVRAMAQQPGKGLPSEPVLVRRRSTVPPTSGKASSVPPEGGAVSAHLRALASIEKGDRRRAERELLDLRREAPDYLPGLFEQALLHVRHGDTASAAAVMTELLQRLSPLADGEVVSGPEDLPVEYYRTAAQAFLARSR